MNPATLDPATAFEFVETDEGVIRRFFTPASGAGSAPLPPQSRIASTELSAGAEAVAPTYRASAMAALAERAAQNLLERETEWIDRIARAHAFPRSEAGRAVRRALLPFKADDLMAQWRREGLAALPAGTFPLRTLVLGGGAIPQPTVLALVAALMTSGRVLYRPSRLDPVLAPALAAEMIRLQRDAPSDAAYAVDRIGRLADRFLCARWPRSSEDLTHALIRRADAVVALGDSATMNLIRDSARPETRLFLYGPGISFAALDLTAGSTGGRIADPQLRRRLIGEAAAPLAEDLCAYDQRGCLSPVALYLIGAQSGDRDNMLEALASVLDSRDEKIETSDRPIPASAALAIQSLRLAYAMDPEGRRAVRFAPGPDGWTLLGEPESCYIDAASQMLRPMPAYRTLRIVPLRDWSELIPAVAPFSGQIQAMGLAPDPGACPVDIRRRLASLGLSRICPLGEMQAPPLDWTHDGNPFFPVRPDVPATKTATGGLTN